MDLFLQVDLKCKELAPGGYFYPDHLPLLWVGRGGGGGGAVCICEGVECVCVPP